MKRGLNKTEVIGNVGEDAVLGQLPSGTPVANFSLAVNDAYKDREGNIKETTNWFKVSIFGKRAEGLAKYITKGTSLYLAGRVGTNAWQTEDGQARADLTLVVGQGNGDFLFLGGGRTEEAPVEAEEEELFTGKE